MAAQIDNNIFCQIFPSDREIEWLESTLGAPRDLGVVQCVSRDTVESTSWCRGRVPIRSSGIHVDIDAVWILDPQALTMFLLHFGCHDKNIQHPA